MGFAADEGRNTDIVTGPATALFVVSMVTLAVFLVVGTRSEREARAPAPSAA